MTKRNLDRVTQELNDRPRKRDDHVGGRGVAASKIRQWSVGRNPAEVLGHRATGVQQPARAAVSVVFPRQRSVGSVGTAVTYPIELDALLDGLEANGRRGGLPAVRGVEVLLLNAFTDPADQMLVRVDRADEVGALVAGAELVHRAGLGQRVQCAVDGGQTSVLPGRPQLVMQVVGGRGAVASGQHRQHSLRVASQPAGPWRAGRQGRHCSHAIERKHP